MNDGVSKVVQTEDTVELMVDAERRAKGCFDEIQMELSKWNCKIDPMVQISGKGMQMGFNVVPVMGIKI